MSDLEQLKSMLRRADITHIETASNLTDDLVGVLIGGESRIVAEFYFSTAGRLLNVERGIPAKPKRS